MFRVFLGLGSNVGDRIAYLTKALDALSGVCRIHALSSVYETEPLGMELEGLNFYNAVAEVETELFPAQLMKELKKIESSLGRKPHTHRQPREIDIDIELYRGYAYEDGSVRVPHPQLENRRFVLEPMYEIAPTAVHAVSGKTVGTMLRQCTDRSRVVRIDAALSPAFLKDRRRIDKTP